MTFESEQTIIGHSLLPGSAKYSEHVYKSEKPLNLTVSVDQESSGPVRSVL